MNPCLNCSIGILGAEGSALKMSFYILKKKKELYCFSWIQLPLNASVEIKGSLLQRFLAGNMLSASSSMFPAPKSDRHRVQNVPEPLRSLGGGELDVLAHLDPVGSGPFLC